MQWIETRITTSNQAVDVVADFARTIGANGVEIIYKKDAVRLPDNIQQSDSSEVLPDNDKHVVVRAHFPYTYKPKDIKAQLIKKIQNAAAYLDVGNIDIATTVVDDEDWANTWKRYYKPFNITKNIRIKPSWEEFHKKDADGKIIIEMDPGMAFGTGTHETTIMCARLIERHIKLGYNVIDIGCGSGILSIVAAKLGAHSVQAVDIDEVAVKVANENIRQNNVADKVHCTAGTIDDLEIIKTDMIFANIIADVIIDLCDRAKSRLKPGAVFIASGIIKQRTKEVLDKFRQNGFSDVEQYDMGEWVAIVFRWQGSL